MVSYDGTLGLQMRAVDVAVDRTTAWGVGVAPSSLVEVDLTEPARPVVKKRPPLDAPPHRGRGQHGLGPRRDRGAPSPPPWPAERRRRPHGARRVAPLPVRGAPRSSREALCTAPRSASYPSGGHSVPPRGAPRTPPVATLCGPDVRLFHVEDRWRRTDAPTPVTRLSREGFACPCRPTRGTRGGSGRPRGRR